MSCILDETTREILELRGFFDIRSELDILKELYYLDKLTKKHNLESQHHQILPLDYWVPPRFYRRLRDCHSDVAVFLAFVRNRHFKDIEAMKQPSSYRTLFADLYLERLDGRPAGRFFEAETNHRVRFDPCCDATVRHSRTTEAFEKKICLEKKHFFSKAKPKEKRVVEKFGITSIRLWSDLDLCTNLMVRCGPFFGAYQESNNFFTTWFEIADIWFKDWNLMLGRLAWAKTITEEECELLAV